MNPYPLKFLPIYKQRIWGGQKLHHRFGKNLPPELKIGESWELADLPRDISVIANGPLAGTTLNTAIQQYPEEITANKNFALPFPLLIKLLDAQDVLSVQVHPDEQTCEKLGHGDPKTECWYIISADENTFIYKGLKQGVTKAQFAKAIKQGMTEELLQKIIVKQGQCHFLPAGTPHAIGPGLLIAEIQTPSDTTYRLFDWNRVDKAGNPRELHIADALESIHFGDEGGTLAVTTTGRLVDCPYFKIDKEYQTKSSNLIFSAGEMKTLVILTGCGTLRGEEKIDIEFRAGDCILVPAAYRGKMIFDDDTEFLTVTI